MITVQELIDELFKVEDKSKEVVIDNPYFDKEYFEKIGEPYMYYFPSGRIMCFQRYKLFNKLYSHNTEYVMCDFNEENIVNIKVKQNKENMEEKKVMIRELTYKYINGKITYEDFEKGFIELLNNKEESKPKLKEFDLEAAKAGKVVCTKDGRKARIICFDRNDLYPIVALIESEDGKEIIGAYSKEGKTEIYEIKGTDLMMLPKKKEGWVNLYKERLYNTKKEALAAKTIFENYIDTVKVEWEE